MTFSATDQPLTDQEFERLAGFLGSIGPSAMNMETLDGYFAALISGPDMVIPSEYLPQIWGEDFSFATDDQASDILGLLMRHWNTIAGELLRTLSEPHVYLPVLLQDEAGVAHGNDWAQGFMLGMQVRAASWEELLKSEENGGPLVIIMLLAHEHDPDPEMRPPPIPAEKREDLLIEMAASLVRIYRYFDPHRRSLARTPLHAPRRREGPKIGRNEPCPCGSGRKYKQCCAAAAPMVH